ncbi:hypothetical protein EV421DRAFT_1984401 [Armillaria borealis]|uniref:Uncharacterized protein n=1 Tax=Armillaria borealis TaxID=47425 RepID=A0AA39JZX3_9AGAR|nr:hypothetical protein EV421DRAFT_1984401 [Armillaria borealis]
MDFYVALNTCHVTSIHISMELRRLGFELRVATETYGIEVIAVFFTMALWAHNHGTIIAASSFWSMDTVHQGLVASGLYKMIRENTTASTDHIRLCVPPRKLFIHAKASLPSKEYIIQILFTVENLLNLSHLFLTIVLLVSQVLVAAPAQGFFAYRI